MTCDLCGAARGPLTIALLQRPWSLDRVLVRACTPCAAMAWRTCDEFAGAAMVASVSVPALLFSESASEAL